MQTTMTIYANKKEACFFFQQKQENFATKINVNLSYIINPFYI